MNFLVTLTIALLSMISLGHAQSAYPECAFTASDYDGDGWGYENTSSCIITDNSSSGEPATAGVCIDTDDDGWGWNGVESCTDILVDQTTTETDTFSELEEIDKHFGTEVLFTGFSSSFYAAVIHCAREPSSASVTYYLRYNGGLYTVGGPLGRSDPTVGFGAWGTGLSTKDGRIMLSVDGVFFPMVISDTEIGFEGRLCSWVTPQPTFNIGTLAEYIYLKAVLLLAHILDPTEIIYETVQTCVYAFFLA